MFFFSPAAMLLDGADDERHILVAVDDQYGRIRRSQVLLDGKLVENGIRDVQSGQAFKDLRVRGPVRNQVISRRIVDGDGADAAAGLQLRFRMTCSARKPP
ncbi:MAG: hypothetical protein M0C28_45935 [Candidatus Moduliflexus flocculans]|nr:hypothetical protein [Candidatus Moduliflexus flocculans]